MCLRIESDVFLSWDSFIFCQCRKLGELYSVGLPVGSRGCLLTVFALHFCVSSFGVLHLNLHTLFTAVFSVGRITLIVYLFPKGIWASHSTLTFSDSISICGALRSTLHTFSCSTGLIMNTALIVSVLSTSSNGWVWGDIPEVGSAS